MNDDVILGDGEPLDLVTAVTIRIGVEVVLAEDDLDDGGDVGLTVRGRNDVTTVDERAAASVQRRVPVST